MNLHNSLSIISFLKSCLAKATAVATGVKCHSTLDETYSCIKTEKKVKNAILGRKVSIRNVKALKPMVYRESDVLEANSVDPSMRTFITKRKINEKP